jgi:hypothetical protein
MAFRILKVNGQVVVRKPVSSLKKAELDDIKIQAEIAILDKGILSTIGDRVSNEGNLEEFPEIPTDFFRPGVEDDLDTTDEPQEPDSSKPDVDSYTEDEVDEFLAAVVDIPGAGEIATGTVSRQVRNADGKSFGRRNPNHLLDTREYFVEFPDGTMDTYSANIVAGNLYSQVDTEAKQYQVISEIIDHRTNGHAVSIDDAFISDKYGKQHRHKTTIGWELLI